jgi:hypothetical protein
MEGENTKQRNGVEQELTCERRVEHARVRGAVRKMTNSNIRYEPCVVSFIDVLGFRSLLGTREATDIHSLLSKLEQFAKPNDEEVERSLGEARVQSRAFSFSVSDAIVRVRPYDTQFHDGAFFSELYDLLHAQIGLIENRVIIRAGVAVGEAYVGVNGDGPLFGPALVRAYEIESQEAIYPRIVVDEDAIAEHEHDHRLRADHNTVEYESQAIRELLATGEDGTRYIDYLRASRSEFEEVGSWLGFLDRHASLVRSGLTQPGNRRTARKYEWLARYHDGCVAELREEIKSSDAISDQLYEDGMRLTLPSVIDGLFVHPGHTTP